MFKVLFYSFALLMVANVNAESFNFGKRISKKTIIKKIDSNKTVFSFNLGSMKATATRSIVPLNKSFKKLKFENLKMTQVSGEPSLPFHSILVKGQPADLKLNVIKGQSHQFDFAPAPAPRKKSRCIDCKVVGESFRGETYSRDETEESLYTLEYLGDFRGVEITKVIFKAADYTGDTLKVYPNAKFEFTGDVETLPNVENLFSKVRLEKKIAVFVPDFLESGLEEYVAHKSSRGYEVEVTSLSIDELQDREYLKELISETYNDSNPTYFILVGNEHIFPTFYVQTDFSPKTPSDLQYFTFGGEDDFYPDVFSGRFVVESVEELENQVSKIIEYETRDFADVSSLKSHIGIASNEGYNPSDEQYIQMMLAPFNSAFETTPDYFFQSKENGTPDRLVESLNKGTAFINYIGHGSGTSWPSLYGEKYGYDEFTTEHIKGLENQDQVKPIIIDVACLNGKFVKGKFGEAFMNHSVDGKAAGAVAYYGGSVEISWNPPAVMAIGINEEIVKKDIKNLGQALMAGQIYLSKEWSNVSEIKDNLEWYHLFGDPSLEIQL